MEFLVGGTDLLGRIEEALQGHTEGATLSLHIEPEEAFGDYNDQLAAQASSGYLTLASLEITLPILACAFLAPWRKP